eukprot:scaffold30377_cov36-Phaeocystis_antarctica.AAC.3
MARAQRPAGEHCGRRAAALVRQHIDGVARASSAGTKSGSIARSLVLLTTRCYLSPPLIQKRFISDISHVETETLNLILDPPRGGRGQPGLR